MEYIPSYSDGIRFDIQPSYTNSLTHHGIKGMKWGVRRFQNKDGSLTPAGQKRFSKKTTKKMNRIAQSQAQDRYTTRKYTAGQLKRLDKLSKKKTGDSVIGKYRQNRIAKKSSKIEQRTTAELQRYKERKEKGEKKLLDLMDSVHKNGLKVSATPVKRVVIDEVYYDGYTYYQRNALEDSLKFNVYKD